MIWLYRILYLPALVISLPYYLWRTFKRGGYARDFHHRLGLLPLVKKKRGIKRIWIQAVSVGEILSVETVIEKLVQRSDTDVVLTTTTSTGYVLAKDRLGKSCVIIGYFPLDFILNSWLAWIRIKPDLLIMVDSVLWPENVHRAIKRSVPVLLVNARLSDKSYHRYLKMSLARKLCFEPVSHFLAASEQDRQRIHDLGIDPSRITVTGNLKVDRDPLNEITEKERNTLTKELFPEVDKGAASPLILVGSSTWPGEESALIETYKSARKNEIDLCLLIVPRHAERRGQIRKEMEQSGVRFRFRTDPEKPETDTRVYIADTTGELTKFTQLGDIVFIGKSLPPHSQGQSPVDAAASGKAILMGPGMSNFRQIAHGLLKEGGAEMVDSPEALTSSVLRLCKDTEERARKARASKRWHQEQKGAVEKSITIISKYLDEN